MLDKFFDTLNYLQDVISNTMFCIIALSRTKAEKYLPVRPKTPYKFPTARDFIWTSAIFRFGANSIKTERCLVQIKCNLTLKKHFDIPQQILYQIGGGSRIGADVYSKGVGLSKVTHLNAYLSVSQSDIGRERTKRVLPSGQRYKTSRDSRN